MHVIRTTERAGGSSYCTECLGPAAIVCTAIGRTAIVRTAIVCNAIVRTAIVRTDYCMKTARPGRALPQDALELMTYFEDGRNWLEGKLNSMCPEDANLNVLVQKRQGVVCYSNS